MYRVTSQEILCFLLWCAFKRFMSYQIVVLIRGISRGEEAIRKHNSKPWCSNLFLIMKIIRAVGSREPRDGCPSLTSLDGKSNDVSA